MNTRHLFFWLLLIPLLSACAGAKNSVISEAVPAAPPPHKIEQKEQAPPALYYNFLMAQMCRSRGDAEGAIKHYNLALSFDPDSTVLLFDTAGLYLQSGKLEEALQACLKIVQRDPAHLHAHILLAGIYSTLQNREAAIEEYSTILRQAPDYDEVYVYLNNLYLELRDYAKAQENMKAYARLQPDSPLPYYYMGKVYVQEKDYRKAETLDSGASAIERKPSTVSCT